jgi:RimJ/RimL family protein N-acetyltransferase
MIDLAIRHKDEVEDLLQLTAFDLKYKYYHSSGYANLTYKPSEYTWAGTEFVFIDKHGKVTGFINLSISNPEYNATISIFNVGGGGLSFLTDLAELCDRMFCEFNINKLSWSLLVGNPAEKLYDRFISQHGGRVVGIKKKHNTSMARELCDVKMYEILKEDYK